MEPWHVIVRGHQWKNSTETTLAKKGPGPGCISIFTERNKQRGDKFLTHVQHLELFGIDVDLLVGGGRGNVLFAAKCVSQKDPKKGKNDMSRELLINGKVASKVIRFLGRIGISEKYISVSKKKGINDGR